MQELIIDGEKGVSSVVGKAYFTQKCIKLNTRGIGQHARFVERRGALMRDILHRCDEQLLAEGITDTPIVLRVGEAVFVGNALISVNNSTPYKTLYGRVPNLLPDLLAFPDEELQGLAGPHTMRCAARLREIFVQKVVEGTASGRIGRTLNTRTLPTVAPTDYKIGYLVEYHRPPN